VVRGRPARHDWDAVGGHATTEQPVWISWPVATLDDQTGKILGTCQ